MTIAPRLQHYLDGARAEYELIAHQPTRSALQNALTCHIPPEQLAKAVLLDTPHDYLLAVLPADRRLGLDDLKDEVGQKPRLADEDELAAIFDDCAVGAVPPLGWGYGIATIVDESLDDQPDIYFESGDHASLVHMKQAEFSRLTQQARHGQFSQPWADVE